MMLIGFILIFVHQNIYSPIECVASPPITSEILNDYCWLRGTYFIFGRPDVKIVKGTSKDNFNTTDEVVKITHGFTFQHFTVPKYGQSIFYPVGVFSYPLFVQVRKH